MRYCIKKYVLVALALCFLLSSRVEAKEPIQMKALDGYDAYTPFTDFEIPLSLNVGDTGEIIANYPVIDGVKMEGMYYFSVENNIAQVVKNEYPEYADDGNTHLMIYDDMTYKAVSPGIVIVHGYISYTLASEDNYFAFNGKPVIPAEEAMDSQYGSNRTIVIRGEDQALFRMYNPNTGEHFYSTDILEKNMLEQEGWVPEDSLCTAAGLYKTNKPIYRMYNGHAGEHLFTANSNEKEMLVSLGWTYEGIYFYDSLDAMAPVYRLYNPNQFSNNHLFTADKTECNYLLSAGWIYEGVAWYGVSE